MRSASMSSRSTPCCFPRICVHLRWQVFLASGIGPNGKGDNSVVVFAPSRATLPSRLIVDPELSPLDLAIAPNSNIVVSSQHPFGAPNAVTSLREYDAADAHLVRIFSAKGSAKFRKPRGLRFGPDGNLLRRAGRGASSECLGITVRLPRLRGQALAFFSNKRSSLIARAREVPNSRWKSSLILRERYSATDRISASAESKWTMGRNAQTSEEGRERFYQPQIGSAILDLSRDRLQFYVHSLSGGVRRDSRVSGGRCGHSPFGPGVVRRLWSSTSRG
jgi:hypothetical protein